MQRSAALEAAGQPIEVAAVVAAFEARTVERNGHITGSKHHPDLDELIALAHRAQQSRRRGT